MTFFIIALFVCIGIVTLGALHTVTYVLPANWVKPCQRGIFALDLMTMLGLMAGPLFFRNSEFGPPALKIAAMFFMAQFFLLCLVYLALGLRFLLRQIRTTAPFDRRLRRELRYGLVYPLLALGSGAYGGLGEAETTVEREFFIPVKGLPKNVRGFRLAQISDVHIGMFFSVEKLRELLERTVRGGADALAITGDIFDDVRLNPAAVKMVDSFVERFPYGIWYCHGNHEHHRGLEAINKLLADTQIHVLVNSAETVIAGERPLVFAGADYPMERRETVFLAQKKNFTQAAWDKIPPQAVVVLLAHHPEFIDNGAEKGAALTLTGHTHGCQIGIFGLPLFPMFKYNRGLVRKGDSFGYVHSGNGSWFPYRLGCPPEIAYFNLHRGENPS